MGIVLLTCRWFALAVLLLAAPARADDLSDFNAAIEMAMSHHRVALGYLRTGNIDLAALELDGMRQAWAKVATLPRPAAFRDKERYTGTMLEIAAGLVGTDLVLKMGRPDVARESLEQVRTSLSRLRRENGVTVLADCVLDANTAMDALFAHDKAPDWNKVGESVDAYRATLQTLRRNGGAERQDERRIPTPDRRSTREVSAQVPKAVETQDADLLHRLLIELRAFDNLLAFRYG